MKYSPMSFEQERLWLFEQSVPGTSSYNMSWSVYFAEQHDPLALEAAINEIVNRHEILRTNFLSTNEGRLQAIAPELTLKLPVIDLRNCSEKNKESEIYKITIEESCHLFNLSEGPLLKPVLLRLSDSEQILLLPIHHIIFDTWSFRVFIYELMVLYSAYLNGKPSPLNKLPIQYGDFALSQRQIQLSDNMQSHISYWNDRLRDVPPLNLRTDNKQKTSKAASGDNRCFEFPKTLSRALKELSSKEGVTLYVTLLAGLKTLLYKYSEQENILIGSPFSGRIRSETEWLIGFFAYPLMLLTDMSGNPTFRELLVRVRDVTMGAYEHQEVPFGKIVDVTKPYHETFQVLFTFFGNQMDQINAPGMTLSLTPGSGTGCLDLFFAMFERGEELYGMLGYNMNRFDSSMISKMLSDFQKLMENAVNYPNEKLTDLFSEL
jgi:hypothetical protein